MTYLVAGEILEVEVEGALGTSVSSNATVGTRAGNDNFVSSETPPQKPYSQPTYF